LSKNVFKSSEVIADTEEISIEAPSFGNVEDIILSEEHNENEESEKEDIDKLKTETEAFEKEFEEKKRLMMEEAEKEYNDILEKAKNEAHEYFKKQNDQALLEKEKIENEAKEIISTANENAKNIENDIKDKETRLLNEARKRGYQDGWDDGYKKGSEEVDRVIERVQTILDKTIERRNQIFVEVEQQIVDLILLIAKKVVKAISESQKEIVLNNINNALQKLKSKGDISIRVNLSDLDMATKHKDEFIKNFENIGNIKILEDTTVDTGGCVIETDFGSIDARISSQLTEIEEKILELVPIQLKPKGKDK
jgi:flagellar assembly protein FliH